MEYDLDGEPGTVAPMSHDVNGWTYDEPDGGWYWLWAPTEGRNEHWAAAWRDADGAGEHVTGKTAARVLGTFPDDVREKFERVIADAKKKAPRRRRTSP